MSRPSRRLDAGLAVDDRGSALAISLVFLMVFGLLIGATLQFAASGQKTTTAIRDEGVNTYAGSGALDGAINRLRTELVPGTEADGTSTCFNMPAGELDNSADVSVTCTPRAGSGATVGPSNAIVALSGNANEGVSLAAAGATTLVRGAVAVNQRLFVQAGMVLTSKTTTLPVAAGSIKAGSCSVAGTADPPCVTPGGAADPGWAGPTTYPAVVRLAMPVVCLTPVMSLSPGTYLNQAALQARLGCPNTVVWFQPGTYYFDFRDGNQELLVAAGDVVVGGTASGWVPGTTPAANVPYPTAALPNASACDRSQTGVNFVFGGTSRISVTGGKVQLCARETSSTKPNIVMQTLPALSANHPAAAPSTGGASTSADTGAGTSWGGDDDEGAVVDGTFANVTVNPTNTARALRIGPFPSNLVPPEATGITVTVDVSGRLNGYGTSQVRLNNNGASPVGPVTLRTCPAVGCSDATVQVDRLAVPVPLADAAAVALVNSLYVDVLVSSSSSGATIADIDGVTVSVDFSAPIRPTSGSGIGAPYTTTAATRRPVLRTSGTAAATVVALHGTVHVPLAVVDLGVTAVPYTVIDRGIVARHVRLAMTPANATVYLIALPVATATPREVLLVAASGSVELARAEARLHDPTGMANGSVVDITAWFVH